MIQQFIFSITAQTLLCKCSELRSKYKLHIHVSEVFNPIGNQNDFCKGGSIVHTDTISVCELLR